MCVSRKCVEIISPRLNQQHKSIKVQQTTNRQISSAMTTNWLTIDTLKSTAGSWQQQKFAARSQAQNRHENTNAALAAILSSAQTVPDQSLDTAHSTETNGHLPLWGEAQPVTVPPQSRPEATFSNFWQASHFKEHKRLHEQQQQVFSSGEEWAEHWLLLKRFSGGLPNCLVVFVLIICSM